MHRPTISSHYIKNEFDSDIPNIVMLRVQNVPVAQTFLLVNSSTTLESHVPSVVDTEEPQSVSQSVEGAVSLVIMASVVLIRC